jgi:hypothetical protein
MSNVDMAGNVVAVSNEVPITAPFSGDVDPINGNAFGAVTGVLKTGNDPLSVTNGLGISFTAPLRNYQLNLILHPASSPCPFQSFIGFVSLSYVLLGKPTHS